MSQTQSTTKITPAAHEPANAVQPTPTLANVAYGSHERQVLDYWRADTSAPAPTLLYIHGGGWVGGSKVNVDLPQGVQGLLDAGISVVSINYRYLEQTIIDSEEDRPAPPSPETVASTEPPVLAPLSDAARALQFVRSHSEDWNIDKRRIAVSGGSAGACSSLWLAFNRDLADSTSPDPIARESTRPWCAAVRDAQTTLDPQQMREWTPNSQYGGHAFGFAWNTSEPLAEFADFIAHRETVLPWIERYSPYALASRNAPPVYLYYSASAPAYGEVMKDPTHTANFGALLAEKLAVVGAEYELVYPDTPNVVHGDIHDYLVDMLKR
ncbi:MAG TPA: alpha/beta hydrolase [Capsulimonadaceae bacterium]|jgi:acetyl esterase/lipase